MDILQRIDDLRKERGWSIYTLAMESGVTQSTLVNMFSRGTQPSIKTLTLLCEAFEISLAQFFDENNEKNILSADELELLQIFRTLNRKEKSAVRALLHELK